MARVKNIHTGPFWRLASGEVGNVPDWMAEAYSHLLVPVGEEAPAPAPAKEPEAPVAVELAPEITEKQKRRNATIALKAEMEKTEDPEALLQYLDDERISIRKYAAKLIEKLEKKNSK